MEILKKKDTGVTKRGLTTATPAAILFLSTLSRKENLRFFDGVQNSFGD
ncbi:MAG: hypothetical protein PVF26_13885 [Desulfobacterales bacterium]|jgi:hypothetical protein